MTRQFTSFYLGDAIFGVDILMTREINRHLDLTPVELVPEFIRGLLNLRGQIVTVLDLGIKLGLSQRQITNNSRILILKSNAELHSHLQSGQLQDSTSDDLVGLLIDGVGDMVTVESNEIEPPPSNLGGVDRRYLNGVVKLNNELMATLEVQRVLALEE